MLISKHGKKGAFIFTPETEKEKNVLSMAVEGMKHVDVGPLADLASAALTAATKNMFADLNCTASEAQARAKEFVETKGSAFNKAITDCLAGYPEAEPKDSFCAKESAETELKRYCLNFALKTPNCGAGVAVLDLAEELYQWITKD
jgi:hypothetical protein